MSEASKGLINKLCEVMASIEEVPKKGYNKFHNYHYATEADLVQAVRTELSKRKLFIFPNVVNHARNGDITDIMVSWTFVDGETGEARECMIPGCGSDKGDKGVYKALTGSEKYLLMKSFLIPTGDDPENESGSDRENGVKAAQAVATQKLAEHAKRDKDGNEILTICQAHMSGFAALSGAPALNIVKSCMDPALRPKYGWLEKGNTVMIAMDKVPAMLEFCTYHHISAINECPAVATPPEPKPNGHAPVPLYSLSEDGNTDPLILEAKSMTGKKGEYLRVKWDGHDMSCFDSKLFPFIKSHINRPAMFDWSSTPKGYKNLLHIVRLGGMPFEMKAPVQIGDEDAPF